MVPFALSVKRVTEAVPASYRVVVHPLIWHRELLPKICGWFQAEWPDWYGPGGKGNAERDLESFAESENALPFGVVAFEHGLPVGVAALKAESIASHRHLSPWAAAGYVQPSHRGHGIGAQLLASLVTKASDLGFSHVYCGTSTSASLLRRSGWSVIEVIEHEGKSLTIFRTAA